MEFLEGSTKKPSVEKYEVNPVRKGRASILPSIRKLMLSISNIPGINVWAF